MTDSNLRESDRGEQECEALEAPPATPAVAKPRHAGMVFALIIAAVFLDVVDFSIVQIALPTIRTQFSVSLVDSQWIVGAYGITMAGFLMLSGRAGDVYGQKKLFIIGVSLFSIASLTGGLAPSLFTLIISRSVQGVGAAISTVTAFSILVSTFPEGQERNRALGIMVAVLSAGFAAGSIAGGVLTGFLGWRSVMFVNVPIGTAAAVLSQKYLPDNKHRIIKTHLDLPGALTITSGLTLLVYALTVAGTSGFASIETILPLALSAVILTSFALIESRSKSPLIPMEFLRRGTVLNANILALIFTSLSGGLGFIITIYLQQILGYSALSAGFGFLPPAAVFFVVGGWGTSRLVSRFGLRSVLITCAVLITVGCALLTQISATGNYFEILPGMLLWSLGASIGFPALGIAALSGTESGEEGLASGLINTSMRVGFPLGLAVLLTISSAMDPQSIGTVSQLASAIGVVDGFRYAFLASTIMGVVGIVFSFKIKNPPENGEMTGSGHNAGVV
ncbi:MAG TPA: MFS transporter [Nitrososphaerales archaeon]|nr:MFS transporter [Nitrososphaerales archaeon]